MSKPASKATIIWLQVNWKAVESNLGEIDVSRVVTRDAKGKLRGESELARLAHASQILGRPVSSFSDLSQAEGDRLVLVYKQELGEEYKEPGYQGARRWSRKRPKRALVDSLMLTKLAEIAADLWPENGPYFLGQRCHQRFRASMPGLLTPAQARSLVEELLQRIAVRECRKRHEPPITREEIESEKEVWRKRFFHIDRKASQDGPGSHQDNREALEVGQKSVQ